MPWYLRLPMFCRRNALDTHDLNPAQRISSQDRRARALPLLRAVDQTVGITAPTLVKLPPPVTIPLARMGQDSSIWQMRCSIHAKAPINPHPCLGISCIVC